MSSRVVGSNYEDTNDFLINLYVLMEAKETVSQDPEIMFVFTRFSLVFHIIYCSINVS